MNPKYILRFALLLIVTRARCEKSLPSEVKVHPEFSVLWKVDEKVGIVREVISLAVLSKVESGCNLINEEFVEGENVKQSRDNCEVAFSTTVERSLKDICDLTQHVWQSRRDPLEKIHTISASQLHSYVSLLADYKIIKNTTFNQPDSKELQRSLHDALTRHNMTTKEVGVYAIHTFPTIGAKLEAGKIASRKLPMGTEQDLTNEFFNVIGISNQSLHCDGKCDINLGVPYGCSHYGSTFTLKFLVPHVSRSEKVLTAHPFKINFKKKFECNNATRLSGSCTGIYTGPRKLLMVSNHLDCLGELPEVENNQGYIVIRGNLSRTCYTERQLRNLSKVNCFENTSELECQIHFDDNGKSLVYCPGGSLLYNGDIFPCPLDVFSVPPANFEVRRNQTVFKVFGASCSHSQNVSTATGLSQLNLQPDFEKMADSFENKFCPSESPITNEAEGTSWWKYLLYYSFGLLGGCAALYGCYKLYGRVC